MKRIFRNRRGFKPLLGTLLLAVVPLTGCGDLLDVEDLDRTTGDSFTDESAIPALQASVRADFVEAYEDLILYTGMLGDEWVASGTFGTRIEVDRRDIDVTNATVEDLFSQISRARAIADFVDDRFAQVDPEGNAGSQRAEVRALSGLALVLMTETYCEGAPMSSYNFDTSEFRYGGPLTRAAVLDSAQTRFNAALDIAAAGSDGSNLAKVGLARALVNAGEYGAAASQVADVPTTWAFIADHSTTAGQNNTIWDFNISQERWSVSDVEGGTGLPYRTATDPRVPFRRTGADVGFDSGTPQFDALKYSDRPAYTVIADGVEARLIEAEAALAAGNPEQMLAILNDLRSQVETLMGIRIWQYESQLEATGFDATLPELELPGTYEEQVDLLFEERAYWLWLTAHRLGDMRRLIRQYNRSTDTVFPVGIYAPNGNPKGGSYGDDVNFPIPAPEANNPEQGAGECLNRNA